MEDIIIRKQDGSIAGMSSSKLVDNLTGKGFAVIANDEMLRDLYLVKVDGKFIERENLLTLEEEALTMTRGTVSEKDAVMREGVSSIKFAKHLPRTNVVAFKDPKDKCHFFFQNGVVVIRRNGDVSFVSADDINTGKSKIWKTAIMQHSYEERSDWDMGEWYRFCRNVVGETGLPYLMRAMGYLLHTYKDPANP